MISNGIHLHDPHALPEGFLPPPPLITHSHPVKEKLPMDGIAAFSMSPGQSPNVAVFVPEKQVALSSCKITVKGSPANVSIFDLSNFTQPLSNKSFFKADSVEFKWNTIGSTSRPPSSYCRFGQSVCVTLQGRMCWF